MFENLVPLTPAHFFAFHIPCYYVKESLEKRHLLPDLSTFHGDFSFAQVFLGWNEKGIVMEVQVKGNFEESQYPNIELGDSVEIFIDTRDIKTTAHTTRFCHHFFFLPTAVEVEEELISAGELTRFRTDDSHPLCDPKLLFTQLEKRKKGKILKIFIPSECLSGYDPGQFDRMGFCYRINRADGVKQYFTANDADFPIESQPALWGSLSIKKAETK